MVKMDLKFKHNGNEYLFVEFTSKKNRLAKVFK